MKLKEYKAKRDFSRTPEPAGDAGTVPRADGEKPAFVVQKHAARRTHYDFRLEMDGVLKSWAVPKGPSLDPAEKRLAVHVEDHPLEYGAFEGVIPKGEYGGGTVMLWDRGWWEPYGDAEAGYAKGDLKFILHGAKLHGRWALVRMKKRPDSTEKADNWLLIKERDQAAQPGSGDDLVAREIRSVATGREMEAITRESDRVWSSKSGGPVAAKPASPPLDPATIECAKQSKTVAKFAPQLAKAVEHVPPGDDWLHEIKFDGYRMISHMRRGQVKMLSRNGLDWTEKFPELVAAIAKLDVGEIVLDGEVVHVSDNGTTSFAGLQDALATGRTRSLVYMLFDLLFLDGWDLTAAALEDRKAALAALLARGASPLLRFSDHQIGRGPDVLAAAQRLGLEGIISKRRDSRYVAGRGTSWTKVKCLAEEEFVIVGYTDPAGERSHFGALLLGYYTEGGELAYAGRVGTGFNDKTLASLVDKLRVLEQTRATVKLPAGLSARDTHWVKPELVAQIRYGDWTTDNILRHSTFVGLREDKAAREVVIEPVARGAAADAVAAAPVVTPVARDGSARLGQVRITNAERIVYPERGLSKLAVAEYYAAVADHLLPHVAGRPLSLLRCPEGMSGDCFFQKHVMAGMPSSIRQVEVPMKQETEHYVMIEDAAGLVALVQMGMLELHPWGSRAGNLEKPDRLIFDLDPDAGLRWDRVIGAALTVRDLLASLGLRSFAKTTGGKGLHLVVPIKPALEWDGAKEFTRAIVAKLAAIEPHLYTVNMAKQARKGRVFIDYLRNGRGATAVAAYSTRARQGATVSAPVSWDEVEQGVRSDQFTVETLPARLAAGGDPWGAFFSVKQAISAAARKTLGS